ncbi:hypothetical protein ACIBG8_32945 [Nonomuraea sp. NPDC050556]|uniref:hypothetical protein n=1 Tax=Nonomuraea sp. NPDC050556 TaxID=3364369 RepID=UPI0037991AF7
MCTASFRMPIEDVGRLLDTLDDGYAEITGEQPAVQEPGEYPGTGQYTRPAQGVAPVPQAPPVDERPTAALPATDVLVARGVPQPDKLVASYGEAAPQPSYNDQPYGDQPRRGQVRQEQPSRNDPLFGDAPAYGREPAGDYGREPSYGAPQYAEPLPGAEPIYQLPSEPRHQRPQSTDPFSAQPQSEPFAAQPQYGAQPAYVPPPPSAAGLGTPMHGIPGAGRRSQPQEPQYGQQPNPVDPLLAMGTQQPQGYQEPGISRPYVGDQMFVTGERLRPDQHDDRSERREW